MKTIVLLWIGMSATWPLCAWSQGADVTLPQLNHRLYTPANGTPPDITAMAQTSDGTLWVGGRAGLARFDGERFVNYPGPSEEPLPGTNIDTLLATPDGGLWIGFRPSGAALLKQGHVTAFGPQQGLPVGSVEQFVRDRNGTVWTATRLGLARFDGSRWEKTAPEIDVPYALLIDRAGTFWVGALNGLFARAAGEAEFRAVDRTLEFGTGGVSLAEAPDGRIYAAPQYKIVRIDAPRSPRNGAAVASLGLSSGPLLIDSDGNLWGSKIETKGIYRIPAPSLRESAEHKVATTPEDFSAAGDTHPGRIYASMQDREGNIWIGGDNGLHRFNRSNVMLVSAPRCYQYGFTAAVLVGGDDGILWVACSDYTGARVDSYRDGALLSTQSTPSYTAGYRDVDGTVWLAGPASLGRIVDGRVVDTPFPKEVQGRPPAGLVRDRSGALWVSLTRRSVYRVDGDRWTEYGNLDALPRGWPTVMTRDDQGVLWFGYAGSRLARVEGQQVTVFEKPQGLDVGNVLSIWAREGQVWVGGELGFARLHAGRFVNVAGAGTSFRGISGIARARNRDMWLNGIDGIVRMAASEVDALLRDPRHRGQVEIFNYLDGVPGIAVQLRPQQSAVETSDGRIWFSMTAGIVSINATRLVRNRLPPPVTIWAMSSGSMRYPNLGQLIHLPVHTTNLQIEYSAGSLSVPERVRFKHKLEGLDGEWQDAGSRREALYTNLRPGNYTFRVRASNNDGEWNEEGAAIAFMIAPAFYQTRWFYALCGLACLAMLAGLYRIRVRQVAAQVRGRLEARLSERERIARELHDTLLQGMQGLIWRFQAAADRLARDEPARELLEQSLDRADRLLAESRDKVKDLRPSRENLSDLCQALAAEGEQFARLHPAQFRISVQGTGRDLHPIVREEMLLIGREALANAFRHSGARTIELDVTYDDAALHLRVRDDGRGIGASVLEEGGRPGHFGLVGMRERAQKLGARLDVWSKPGAGTEVDLRVPAEVAYRKTRPSLALVRNSAQGH